MKYVVCGICSAVIEGRGWGAFSDMHHHFQNNHPDIIKKINEDEERYQNEMVKIKKPLEITEFWTSEDLPKKIGRKEYENQIINLKENI